MRTFYFLVSLFCLQTLSASAFQQIDERPKPSRCGSCLILKKKEKGKISKIILGYDNTVNHQYHAFKANKNESFRAIERVIFLYDSSGLQVISYIPTLSEQLNRDSLESFISQYSKLPSQKTAQKKPESKEPGKQQQTGSGSSKSNPSRALSEKPVGGQNANPVQEAEIKLYHITKKSDVDSIYNKSGVTKQNLGIVLRTVRIESPTAQIATGQPSKVRYRDFTPPSHREMRDIYRAYRVPKFYIEAGSVVGLTHRDLQIVSTQPDRKLLEARLRREHPGFGNTIGVRFGYHINDRSSIYSGYMYSHQQFQGLDRINWSTGLQAEAAGNKLKNYRFDSWGREVGYSYMPYRKKTGLSVDLGLHFLWIRNQSSIQQFTFGPHASIGPKIRLGSILDLRIMPTIYYNIAALEKNTPEAGEQQFATRLFTTGVRMSLVWTK